MTALRALCLGVLAVGLAGCGGGGLTVTGEVRYGGQPLPSGTIAFEPEAGSGTTGPGANGTIRDGKFTIPKEKNLVPGRYVVRIGPEPLGSGADLKTAPPQFPPLEQKIELKPGAGPLTFDVPAGPRPGGAGP